MQRREVQEQRGTNLSSQETREEILLQRPLVPTRTCEEAAHT